jgi:hypothetical protein
MLDPRVEAEDVAGATERRTPVRLT